MVKLGNARAQGSVSISGNLLPEIVTVVLIATVILANMLF
jgi:hypothetical protein